MRDSVDREGSSGDLRRCAGARSVREPAAHLRDLVPYDPKYIPAEVMVSANENPDDVPESLRTDIMRAIRRVALNRYPDPLANGLRDLIAEANGLDRDQVLIGNGGDELLFDTALAWGGPGRVFLNMPPTFSVYENNALLTGTSVVEVPRRANFRVDEEAVVARLSRGDVDFTIVTSPNNPTGDAVSESFVRRVLEASDALVVVDEAYFEFSRKTVRPLLENYENLVILRTFSKAFSLAGVRVGYLLGSERVLSEYKKVRQPYSVDAISQVVASTVYENRSKFVFGIERIVSERERMFERLGQMDGIEAFPSESNFILLRMEGASDAWRELLARGVLVRDFSRTRYLEGCLRVSVGTPQENDRFLQTLADIAASRRAR
ncbi:histidinol-phosphate transaminase [Berryella intestinalis]|uniref:histidinol-phosphate transaminase n=1 Tax=Berryella intestinalis TaxID=1531429 RepID=UPI000691C155|nr:histidinol-phosphate transaminase [Berryella intestinalis]